MGQRAAGRWLRFERRYTAVQSLERRCCLVVDGLAAGGRPQLATGRCLHTGRRAQTLVRFGRERDGRGGRAAHTVGCTGVTQSRPEDGVLDGIQPGIAEEC